MERKLVTAIGGAAFGLVIDLTTSMTLSGLVK
jgi:hypothetical protein